MKNVTIALDESLIRDARRIAADRSTTLNAMIREFLQEFYVNVTRKIEHPLAPDAAVGFLDEFRRFPLVQTDYPLVVAGVELGLRYGISYWDGAIVAAAERLGASILFSEALIHEQRYGSVQVVNPFRFGGPDRVHEGTESG